MSSQISKAFTLCVDGRPTLTFSAQRFGEARELCKETWLREDLRSLRSNGKPLCDAQSSLRCASRLKRKAPNTKKASTLHDHLAT